MSTKKEVIARFRNAIKEVSADSVYTDRYLWHIYATNAKNLLRTAIDRGLVYAQNNIWTPVCTKMEPVSSLLCNCFCLPYDCTVYRSKLKLPKFVEGPSGMAYRFIATPDISAQLILVTPYQYSIKSKIKYNKEKYVFIHDGFLYTPGSTYPQLIISALFEEDVSKYDCAYDSTDVSCGSALVAPSFIPDYLEDYAIKAGLQELFPTKQLPTDEHPNANPTQTQGTP